MPTKLALPLLVVLQDECSDSTMTPDSGSGLTMTSSATYTNGGNLVYTQTDTRGNTVTNSYYNVATGKYDLNYMLGAPYMTTDPPGQQAVLYL
ncbi:MAG: hypothetical protein E7459_07020 [Ruminococcaceae bacterium]|nr:hypothetical protein [Oscillospiraceae bacterium]